MPLTADRAKAYVPFGGSFPSDRFCAVEYRGVGYLKIVVLTQYKSLS